MKFRGFEMDEEQQSYQILIQGPDADSSNQLLEQLKDVDARFVIATSNDERNGLLAEDHYRILIISKQLEESSVANIAGLKENFLEHGHIVVLSRNCRDYAEALYDAGVSGLLESPHRPNELKALIVRLLLNPEDNIDHKGRRSDVQLPIVYRFSHGSDEKNGLVTNLAKGGIFIIEKDQLPRPKSLISFNILLPGESEEVQGNGIVRWTRETADDEHQRGFGVEFIGISEKSLPSYLKLVKRIATPAKSA